MKWVILMTMWFLFCSQFEAPVVPPLWAAMDELVGQYYFLDNKVFYCDEISFSRKDGLYVGTQPLNFVQRFCLRKGIIRAHPVGEINFYIQTAWAKTFPKDDADPYVLNHKVVFEAQEWSVPEYP